MVARTLSQTLEELIGGVVASGDAGLRLTEAEFDLPVEVILAAGPDGPVLLAEPSAVRWHTGFEAVVHRLRLVVSTGGDGA
ncbi:MAG: hypothetical protein ACXW3O_00500 [Brevundimonas sp.]